LSNILEFEHDFPGCRVVKLERNYRSTKKILRVADHLIKFNRDRKAKALLTENPAGAPVVLSVYPTEADEARAVAAKVREMIQDQGLNFGDFAVFCRVTALTRNFESAFRAAQIPYQVIGGFSFYERQEVKDLLAYLNLMANPKDDIAFQRVVNVPPRGLGATSIEHLAAYAHEHDLSLLTAARRAREIPGLKDKAIRSFLEFVSIIDRLAAIKDQSAEQVTRRLQGMTGYREYLEQDAKGGGDDRRANLDELVSAAREFDREHPGASVLDFMEEVTLASAVDRWKDDMGAVKLMTLHAAKGLEFPVVFIVGLEQGLLPHSRSSENRSETEEERRLFFVGITRAQRELYLSRCRIREFRGQRQVTIASVFLSELPDDALVVRDSAESFWSLSPALERRSEVRSAATSFSGGPRLTTAAALGQSQAKPGASDLDAFQPGVAVLHPNYGIGRIVEIQGAGPDRKGRIAFTVGPERTFVIARSPLRVIPGQVANRPPRRSF
jgi:DNA helicase-2/ATP-dependent DNA helicase PcrA